jgi:hypothetical protein
MLFFSWRIVFYFSTSKQDRLKRIKRWWILAGKAHKPAFYSPQCRFPGLRRAITAKKAAKWYLRAIFAAALGAFPKC